MMSSAEIDIILPWVDGEDSKWQTQKNKYALSEGMKPEDNSEIRYKNWDNLKYWFRAVEKNMPWVRNIFFVTWGHKPGFFVSNHPKIKIVRHEDYIPEEYLPTFNSDVIELNYHRISELSENFILFNDDCFPIATVDKEYYFRDGMVCDEAVESPIVPNNQDTSISFLKVKINDIAIINSHFNKRTVQEKHYDKWFSNNYGDMIERNERLSYWNNFVGFHDPHLPVILNKSILEKLWILEPEVMHNTCTKKFRSAEGVNQYLIRYWQLCEGNFYPRKYSGKVYSISDDNYEVIAKEIEKKKYNMVCLSEHFDMDIFDVIKDKINSSLEKLFPLKSSFEV